MFDKIYYVNEGHVVIYFDTHHINVYSDQGDALNMAARLLAPFPSERLEEGKEFESLCRLMRTSEEDTVIIDIKKIA